MVEQCETSNLASENATASQGPTTTEAATNSVPPKLGDYQLQPPTTKVTRHQTPSLKTKQTGSIHNSKIKLRQNQ